MGVEKAQAAQTRIPAFTGQRGNKNAFAFACQDKEYLSLPVNKHGNLSRKRARKKTQLLSLGKGKKVINREAALVEPFKGVKLTWLEAFEIAFSFGNADAPVF